MKNQLLAGILVWLCEKLPCGFFSDMCSILLSQVVTVVV